MGQVIHINFGENGFSAFQSPIYGNPKAIEQPVYASDEMVLEDVIFETVMDVIDAVLFTNARPVEIANQYKDRILDIMEEGDA